MATVVRESSVVRFALQELWSLRFRQTLPCGLTNQDAWRTLSECGLTDDDLRAALLKAYDPALERADDTPPVAGSARPPGE